MLDELCSRFLPPVHPPPLPSVLLVALSRLDAFFNPPNTVVDLRRPVTALSESDVSTEQVQEIGREKEQQDDFERNYARGWLERTVVTAAKALGRGEDQNGEWEHVVSSASELLAILSGPSAQGSSLRTYLLPAPLSPLPALASAVHPAYPTPPPSRPASTPSSHLNTPRPASPSHVASTQYISLAIRDTTLLQNSTGHRTWGSAPILSQRLAMFPSVSFPPSPSASYSLRVLELGSGTGLVGLSAAAVLSRLNAFSPGHAGASVTLTDGGPEPAEVRDNLQANALTNEAALSGVQVLVEHLDWRDFLPASSGGKGRTVKGEDKYDVILAADVAYEPGMAEALHAAVSALLRLPTQSSSSSTAAPAVFHLVIPLRRTHTAETAAVKRLFPSPQSTDEAALARTEGARRWRLIAKETEELVGSDGFSGGGARGRGIDRAEGEMRYLVFRMEWEEVL
ncbi:hypothetical protein JCM11641_007695 [Rhodosporidiobolus odoratus]